MADGVTAYLAGIYSTNKRMYGFERRASHVKQAFFCFTYTATNDWGKAEPEHMYNNRIRRLAAAAAATATRRSLCGRTRRQKNARFPYVHTNSNNSTTLVAKNAQR